MLSSKYADLLLKYRCELMKSIKFEGTLLWDKLKSLKFCDDVTIAHIKGTQKAEHGQVGAVLDYIERRPDEYFHLFVRALKETNHSHVVQKYLIPPESAPVSQPVPATTNPVTSASTQETSAPTQETSAPTQETSGPTGGAAAGIGLAQQMGDLTLAQETENGIRLCPLQFYEDRNHRLTVYNMRRKVKGNAIIINNYNVEGQRRPGSNKDLQDAKKLFKDMQFNVWTFEDLVASKAYVAIAYALLGERHNAENIRGELEKFAKGNEAEISTCCFVVLMSHGERDGITGKDGEVVALEHIWALFSDANSPGYKGKPKVFVINACQMDARDCQTVRLRHKDASPAYPDMFMAYSTTPGHGSIRDREQGSWYIQEMVKVFRQEAADTSVQSLFDKVGGEVRQRISERGETQQPETRSRLSKDFFLFPGRHDYE